MPPDDDETVRLKPAWPRPALRRLLAWGGAAVVVLLFAVSAGWMLLPAPRPQGAVPATSGAVAALPVASEAAILAHRAEALTLFRFLANPAILVLDFGGLHEQGLMFNRVAAFAEKVGEPHDRVLTDAELDRAIHAHGDTIDTYYYGHDYSAATLRRFFELADRDGVTLTAEEAHLHRILGAQGLLADGAVGAVISVPREGADALVDVSFRRTILHHELSHGEYFTNAAYAEYAHRFWDTGLDEAEREAFRRFLAAQDYDPALTDLTINETQAYLMHTVDRRAFSAEALGLPEPVLRRLQANFLLGMPPGWLRDCTSVPPLGSQAAVARPNAASPRQRSTVRTGMARMAMRSPRRSAAAKAA